MIRDGVFLGLGFMLGVSIFSAVLGIIYLAAEWYHSRHA